MTVSTTSLSAEQTTALGRGFEGFDLRAVNRDGVSLGYRVAGDGPVVVLVHGYPQSGLSWRTVAADLAHDHRVVLPDYRAAPGSDVPADGYDKITMAHDLATVLADAGVGPAHVVGHDFGMMIAYAYAQLFPSQTRTLTLMDAVIPGIPSFRALIGGAGLWHFGFNAQVEMATAVVTGRERAYFDWFFDNFCANPAVLPPAERDFYVAAAQRPGALRAQFLMYAAAAGVDAEANERALASAGRLAMPTFGIGGAYSMGPYLDGVLTEVATDTRVLSVEGTGHYLPEEKPEVVAGAVRAFVSEHP